MRKFLFLLSAITLVFGFTGHTSAATVTVKAGDSMWKIAKRYNVSFTEVLRLNKEHHINPNLIHPNDIVYIPDTGTGTATTNNSATDNIAQGNASIIEYGTNAKIDAVLKIVNQERQKHGLQALILSTKLTDIATEKALDMAKNNYFSHTSPTYGTPFQMLQKFGVTYRTAGENIAAGQKTPEAVMQSWMNSSGHRANILNANYNEIGIGYTTGGQYGTEWVQLFIGK